MKPPSLRSHIRYGTLGMLAVALALGALALPEVHQLGGAIRDTLYRNYLRIEAAQHMNAALWRVELAMRDGDAAAALVTGRDEFVRYIEIDEQHITETGEAQLAADIARRGHRLFAEISAAPSSKAPRQAFAELHQSLDKLIALNRDAMFRADSRSVKMSDRLTYEFTGALALQLVFGAILSWTLAWSISRPLDELADRLRSFSLRGPSVRLGKQQLDPFFQIHCNSTSRTLRWDRPLAPGACASTKSESIALLRNSIRSLSISLRQRSTLYSAVWPRAVGIPLWSPCASWLKANSSP
jgi:hypothetical protein